ncbi:MAG: NTP transferase domain-containing protein [Steroidobacteraceae bacterium]
MASADLYIIAAGSGSRINANVPKALVPIADEPCLTTTLQQIGLKFMRVFVVTNTLLHDQWRAYLHSLDATYPELARLIVNIPIKSGLGDGHATLQGIVAAGRMRETALSRDIVIAWGDVFFPNAGLIDELLSLTLKGSGLIPAIHKSNPYVSLLVDDRMRCVSADFTKYGEYHLTGFHDQSVFRFDRQRLGGSLRALHRALWKNGRYITPGGELSLLYAFHQLYNSGDPAYVYETEYPTFSFNTVEEVAAIQLEISNRWKSTMRKGRPPTMEA